jgi:uncharacterized protein (TIGR03000 family)
MRVRAGWLATADCGASLRAAPTPAKVVGKITTHSTDNKDTHQPDCPAPGGLCEVHVNRGEWQGEWTRAVQGKRAPCGRDHGAEPMGFHLLAAWAALAVSSPGAGEALPARLIVLLPAEARLSLDGAPCPLAGARRAFDTPPLEPGRQYMYAVRVEWGQKQVTASVPVRGGDVLMIDFGDLGKPAAVRPAAAARLSVHLPAAARLFLGDAECPLTSGTRSFDTAPLEPGRDYSYLLRAEIVVGRTLLVVTKRVTVRAGRLTCVDWRDLGGAVRPISRPASAPGVRGGSDRTEAASP